MHPELAHQLAVQHVNDMRQRQPTRGVLARHAAPGAARARLPPGLTSHSRARNRPAPTFPPPASRFRPRPPDNQALAGRQRGRDRGAEHQLQLTT